MSMLIKTFTFNHLRENTYIVADELEKVCCIIDPGCYEKEEEKDLSDYIFSQLWKVQAIINTHCHIDHVAGNAYCKRILNAPIVVHAQADATLRQVPLYAPLYGFHLYQPTTPDIYLNEGESYQVGRFSFQILDVPGHSEGHLALFEPTQRILFSGDVLFHQGIGRYDLPGGNLQKLQQSIIHKLYTLPDDTIVYPGHGKTTTIGFEKIHNPYISL